MFKKLVILCLLVVLSAVVGSAMAEVVVLFRFDGIQGQTVPSVVTDDTSNVQFTAVGADENAYITYDSPNPLYNTGGTSAHFDYLSGLECTTLLLCEKSYNKRGEASYDMEEFIADGIINLYLVPKETSRLRVLEITKMRDTDHTTNLAPYRITPQGLDISPTTGIFTKVE